MYVDNIDIGSNKSRANSSAAEQEEANTSKHSHGVLVMEQLAKTDRKLWQQAIQWNTSLTSFKLHISLSLNAGEHLA